MFVYLQIICRLPKLGFALTPPTFLGEMKGEEMATWIPEDLFLWLSILFIFVFLGYGYAFMHSCESKAHPELKNIPKSITSLSIAILFLFVHFLFNDAPIIITFFFALLFIGISFLAFIVYCKVHD